MRGVVSLAAALSIPVQMSNGALFPHRSLVLFITFIVILATLLLQGLTLPRLIASIKMPDFDDYLPEEEAENYIHREMAKHALQHLHDRYERQWKSSPVLQQLASKWEGKSNGSTEQAISGDIKLVYLELLDKQRQWLIQKNNLPHQFDEDIIRKHLRLIDIEEEKINSL